MGMENSTDILEYIQKIIAIMGIRKRKSNQFNIFEIMKDKYQIIIDHEKIKLKLRLAQIDKEYKHIKLTLYFSFFIVLGLMLYFFFCNYFTC